MSVRVTTDIAARIAGVRPGTVRQWIARGIILRHPDGIDVDEMFVFLDTIRNTDQARGAVVATHARFQTRRAG